MVWGHSANAVSGLDPKRADRVEMGRRLPLVLIVPSLGWIIRFVVLLLTIGSIQVRGTIPSESSSSSCRGSLDAFQKTWSSNAAGLAAFVPSLPHCRRRQHAWNPTSSLLLPGWPPSSPWSSSKERAELQSRRPMTDDPSPSQKASKQSKPKGVTLKEFSQRVLDNPAKYLPETNNKKKKKSNYKRTRKRVENPQQTYLYATQRRALQLERNQQEQEQADGGEHDTRTNNNNKNDLQQYVKEWIREFHIPPGTHHHCNPEHEEEQPVIRGQIRVSDELHSSNAFAYLIEKPAGWAIVGSKATTTTTAVTGDKDDKNLQKDSQPVPSTPAAPPPNTDSRPTTRSRYLQRVKLRYTEDDDEYDKDKTVADYVEYDELQVFALMTPTEVQEFLEEGGTLPEGMVVNAQGKVQATTDHKSNQYESSTTHPTTTSTAESGVDYYLTQDLNQTDTLERWNPTQLQTIRRIQARQAPTNNNNAGGTSWTRPSVIQWLKDHVATNYNRTIRGGNVWKAVAGATQVDDSGLVLVCPKTAVPHVYCDASQYLAVVGGTGNHVAAALDNSKTMEETEAAVVLETMAKVQPMATRTDRAVPRNLHNTNRHVAKEDIDVVETLSVTIPNGASTCNDVVPICQEDRNTGIRGDPATHPLDRRAGRRLIHCQAMTVSSLLFDDDPIHVESTQVPDDIAVWSKRGGRPTVVSSTHRSQSLQLFTRGSFLGRSALQHSNSTSAYREINGAADGFPGWTVDRYGKWLWVQHDPNYPRGPLPSIHDGYTAGVYYLETRRPNDPTLLAMDQHDVVHDRRPRLLEGQAAPALFPVLENGIQYLVSLEKDLSTGLFLDQRPQRQWLARHCGPTTRVLNCFAHTGAFSVAAATAGASTVSIDLSQKWLQRLPEHFQANGMEFDERHDAIYGDCFDWLHRLAKRGETYDIVILDPPSASFVGGRKKKRWSVQQDTPELVALAAKLVQPGGLLWTTTNHAGISALQWARLCQKGLLDHQQARIAAEEGTGRVRKPKAPRLERVQPMPTDFPSIGAQNVKNLVWRIP